MNKIIGHTESGKPVYEGQEANQYSDFTKQDHKEAAQIHFDYQFEQHIAETNYESGGAEYDEEDEGDYGDRQHDDACNRAYNDKYYLSHEEASEN